jgi:lysophospholipase L1-like esterase
MKRLLIAYDVLLFCACALAVSAPKARAQQRASATKAEAAQATAASPSSAEPNGVAPWARKRTGEIIATHIGEHTAPATPPPPGLYAAMGDSITFGVGVSKNCQAFPTHPVDIEQYCPGGTSYAVLVAKALRKAGVAGHFMNLGISGAHVERVISDELPYLPANTTVVTLYIGTNDSRAVRSAKHSIEQVVDQFETHFDELLAMIHHKAPNARIVLINFPNERYLAAAYHVPDPVLPLYDATSQDLAAFIDSHYPRYAVADTICNPTSYDETLHYKGTVHPDDAGSALLARSVVDVILASHPPAPPTSCKWFDAKTAPFLSPVQPSQGKGAGPPQ